MTSKIYRIDNPRASRWPGPRMTDATASEDLPDRTGGYQELLDQGLRLNRAFISIKDPLVREAIVNLVVEAAKNENGEEVPPPTECFSRTGRRKPGFWRLGRGA